MGTYNHLLRLGRDTFLEVIAIDPAAAAPAVARWFGLDDVSAVRSAWEDGRRLRAWVARTRNLDTVLAHHGDVLGRATRVSRGDLSWLFAVRPDGSLPAGGVAPSVIDWGERGSPAAAMQDLGAGLNAFAIEHPDPAWVADLYRQLDIENAPQVRKGSEFLYRATIETPRGLRELW